MSTDKYQRQADRRNARAIDAAPLLAHAGLVPLVTAEEQRRQMARWRNRYAERMGAGGAALIARSRRVVAALALLLEPESMEDLLQYRWRTYPPTPEYGADFWRGVWERLRAGKTAMPQLELIGAWECVS